VYHNTEHFGTAKNLVAKQNLLYSSHICKAKFLSINLNTVLCNRRTSYNCVWFNV